MIPNGSIWKTVVMAYSIYHFNIHLDRQQKTMTDFGHDSSDHTKIQTCGLQITNLEKSDYSNLLSSLIVGGRITKWNNSRHFFMNFSNSTETHIKS